MGGLCYWSGMHPSRRRHRESPSDRIAILLEEYRQVYGLALFRLNALDQRVPIIVAALTAMLGSVGVLPREVQLVLLVALPLTLLWLIRTTLNHARSFEDALRRIEEIEQTVTVRTGERLLRFQSSHPSRGKYVGGRTGTETVEAVLVAAAVLQGAGLYLCWTIAELAGVGFTLYAVYLGAVVAVQLGTRWMVRRYRYRPIGDTSRSA